MADFRICMAAWLIIGLLCPVSCGRCHLEAHTADGLVQCSYQSRSIQSIRNISFPAACQFVDLSDNLLTKAENFAFVNLRRLLYLDLSLNKIQSLQSEAFTGLNGLLCLDLSQNQLNLSYKAYPRTAFSPLANLKVLFIGGNSLSQDLPSYPDASFQALGSLEKLQLDLFTGVQFGPGFSHLRSLKELSCYPSITEFGLRNYTFIPFENSRVTTLTLMSCSLHSMEMMTLKPFSRLENLSLADSKLGIRSAIASLAGLRGANLSDVNFAHVNWEQSDTAELTFTDEMLLKLQQFCIRSLDLSDNLIINVEITTLFLFNRWKCLETLKMNRWFLQRKIQERFLLAAFVSLKVRRLEMAESVLLQKEYKNAAFAQRTPFSNHTSRIITFLLSPFIEVVNISRNRLTCRNPNKQEIIAGGTSMHTMDISYSDGEGCFNRSWFRLKTLKHLNISGNKYSHSRLDIYLSGLPNLISLVARDSPLMEVFKINQTVLSGLKYLRHLDIANSGLTTLPTNLLQQQTNIQTVDISYNRLTSIPDLIYSLSSLRKVDIRFNAISEIPLPHRRALDAFVQNHGYLQLWLDGNPLVCNCHTYDFIEWIWTTVVKFDQQGNYSCILDNGSLIPILNLKANIADMKLRCISSFWLEFAAVGSSVLLLILLASVIIYRYRVPIKYWCYSIRRKVTIDQNYKRYKYDVFVAFCHEDHQWVYDRLYPMLTGDYDTDFIYKLCLYDKDFTPGVPIEENIIAAVQSSYKIIMVISPAFMSSVWCRLELQMVNMKMIQEGREDLVIPIILQDVPVSTMPRSLLNLWNTSVFLIWLDSPGEQRHFWKNLITALGPALGVRENEDQSVTELLVY